MLPPTTLMSPGGQPAANFALPPPYSSAQSSKFNAQQQQQQQQHTPQRTMWQQQQQIFQQQQSPPPPYVAASQGQIPGVPIMGIASSQQVQLPHQTASAMKVGIAQGIVPQQMPMMATMPQQATVPLPQQQQQQPVPSAVPVGSAPQQVRHPSSCSPSALGVI